MREPVPTVPLRDAMTRTPSYAAQGIGLARCEASDVLLLERPARFDRIEVGRVRRQVHKPDLSRGAGRCDSRIMVRVEIVHDHDISCTELRQQLALQPSDEAVPVRGRKHAREDNPSGQTNGSEQREVLAPIHRNGVDEFLSPPHPGMAAAHRGVEPGLVEEDQSFGRYSPDRSQIRGTLGDDVRPQTLQRPSAFFLTTNPCRRSARLMLETCTRSRRARCRLISAASSPAVASGTFVSAASR